MIDDPSPAGLKRWLREKAWPIWLERGVDRARGGFFETLDLHHHSCHVPFRRLRVAARQIFVFSAAHRYGLAGADEAVRLGLHFLENHAAHEEGGYAWRFDLDHHVIDATRDLYDHAFVLLALASAAGIAPREDMRAKALELVAWIEAEFRHPSEGYVESLPPALPRRQNPHMHLLEALLAAHETFGDPIFLQMATRLVHLFAHRFLDPASGMIAEFLDDDLRPATEMGLFLAEPGHCYEWAWLLAWFRRCSSGAFIEMPDAIKLRNSAEQHGLDPAIGSVRNAVWSDGSIADGAFRLWPQAERLRAETLWVIPEREARVSDAAHDLAQFLRPDGLWHERRAKDGSFSNEPAPASSLYHLTGSILAMATSAR